MNRILIIVVLLIAAKLGTCDIYANTWVKIKTDPFWIGATVHVDGVRVQGPGELEDIYDIGISTVPLKPSDSRLSDRGYAGTITINLLDNLEHHVYLEKKVRGATKPIQSNSFRILAPDEKLNETPRFIPAPDNTTSEDSGSRTGATRQGEIVIRAKNGPIWVSLNGGDRLKISPIQKRNFNVRSGARLVVWNAKGARQPIVSKTIAPSDIGKSFSYVGRNTGGPDIALVIVLIGAIFVLILFFVIVFVVIKKSREDHLDQQEANPYENVTPVQIPFENCVAQIASAWSSKGRHYDSHLPPNLSELQNHFEALALLDSGGMGNLYRARARGQQSESIVKVLKPEFCKPEHMVYHLFIHEFKIMDFLRAPGAHPNIIRMGEIPPPPGQSMWFEMELLEPGKWITLKALQDELRVRRGDGRIPLDRAIPIIRSIIHVVNQIHTHGNSPVIHGDLTPSNIMLSLEDLRSIKVIDFGSAYCDVTRRHLPDESLRFKDNIGKPDFIPEEQARGGVSAMGPAGDWYSVGISLWKLLTDQMPYEPGNRKQHQQGGKSAQDLITLCGIGANSAQTIVAMFHPNPTYRPSNDHLIRAF